ncbi:MAG: hypothetical protein J6R05_04635 [Bacteroidaceae bacterium]|nr:hypothetical protein [Bacteroidaceae bacterium]
MQKNGHKNDVWLFLMCSAEAAGHFLKLKSARQRLPGIFLWQKSARQRLPGVSCGKKVFGRGCRTYCCGEKVLGRVCRPFPVAKKCSAEAAGHKISRKKPI